jgi:hypothetical protein
MKKFEFEVEFSKVLEASRILLEILRSEKPSDVSGLTIENVNHIVVPRTVESLRAFYIPLFGPNFKEKNIITFEDFNHFEVVDIDRSHFSIHLFSDGTIYIGLLIGQEYPYAIGEIGSHTLNGMFYFYYEVLPKELPFDLTNKKNPNFSYMHNRISDITRLAIATVSLTYTLYNFDDIQVKGKDTPLALDYVNSIKEKIRTLGDNVVEVIEKLGAFSLIML